MSTYTLVYFDGRGRAELSRMLFAAAGKVWEDERVPAEEWAKKKMDTKRFPQGALPVLEVDKGKFRLSQSLAIARFLAREFGLNGKNKTDEALIDQIMETCLDMTNPWLSLVISKDKEEEKTKYKTETLLNKLGILEGLLPGGGYAVGKTLSIADLQLYCSLEFVGAFEVLDKDNGKKYPQLKSHRETVEKEENIKKYLKTRPQTQF